MFCNSIILAFLLICYRSHSGEKTSTKEWASSLEIKGRVRLDAFEKFLQELPMSRSRAVMVSQVSFYLVVIRIYLLLRFFLGTLLLKVQGSLRSLKASDICFSPRRRMYGVTVVKQLIYEEKITKLLIYEEKITDFQQLCV